MWIMVEPVAEIPFGIHRSPMWCYGCNTYILYRLSSIAFMYFISCILLGILYILDIVGILLQAYEGTTPKITPACLWTLDKLYIA
jgi:hypothetical protein